MSEPIGPEDVWRTLATIPDPEFGLNIVDMGLVYDVAVNQGRDVQVRMTLTSPACPAGEMIHGGAYAALGALPGVGKRYAERWLAEGHKTWRQVFALFIEKGVQGFDEYARKDIGMDAKNRGELVSALEAKWNSLRMVGTRKDQLPRTPDPGHHSLRVTQFLHGRLADAESLHDFPFIGDVTAAKWNREGITTVDQ